MESFIFILWKILFISQLLSVHLGNCELHVQAEAGDVLLVNPRNGNSREGIVKVFLDDDWHWISPDGFKQPTATVLCRRAGFNGKAMPDKEVYLGPAPPTKILTCDGEEVTPLDCTIEDTDPEGRDYSVSYGHDFDVWEKYTGAYVICNELDLPQGTEGGINSTLSIVLSIVLLVLTVPLVILFACLFHRRILQRELAKMATSKDPATQYTSLNLENVSSNQETPAMEVTSCVSEVDDKPTASNTTYSSRLYQGTKGVNAAFEDEYARIDETKDKKTDH